MIIITQRLKDNILMSKVRVIFLCNISALAHDNGIRQETGGSWIEVLIKLLKTHNPNWSFGVSGEGTGRWGEIVNGITRYPVSSLRGVWSRLKKRFSPIEEERQLLPDLLKAIEDFKPDIIHIFGSEFPYGIVCDKTNIPCIIHFQGCLPAYANAKYPPNIEKGHYWRNCKGNLLRMERAWYFDRMSSYRTKREERILAVCSNYFGRTEWDKAIIEHYHPDANYFYCSEVLREPFYVSAGQWRPKHNTLITIVSLISTPLYKGQDLILKTAKLLKGRLDIQWIIIGVWNSDMQFWEKRTGIRCEDVNVKAVGRIADANVLRDTLLSADIYLHPSYIDNSPNSLCEAQILGLPCIATAVGGVPSLVDHEKNGILIPANDPYMAAWQIRRLAEDKDLSKALGKAGALEASRRHNKTTIISDVLKGYISIRNNSEN